MKKYKLIAFSALIAAGLTSCELTEKPSSYYEKDTYFQTYDQAKMSVIGLFDCLANEKHYGQFEMAVPTSDDTYYIQGTGTDNTRRDIAHYMVKSTNTWVATLWEYKYMGIDRANFAIAGIEAMEGYAEDAALQELVAQAKFVRAFLSFDLVKCWGDVPYKTTFTSIYDEAFKGRVDREEIYRYIIEDLDFAKNKLQASSASLSPEVPSQGAAHALLMRVYLQRAGYSLQMNGQVTRPSDDKRKAYFDAVLAEWTAFQEKGYHDFNPDGYQKLFEGYSANLLNSKESLWEIAFNPTGAGYKDNAGQWGTYNGPSVQAPGKGAVASQVMGRANAFFRVMPAWKDFFEEGDERRDVMVCTYQYKWENNAHKKVENKKLTDWYPGKWRREWMPKGFYDPNITAVNFCPLRYADVVLMAAEAYNETGNTPEAWRLLNMVRHRAGATEVNSWQAYKEAQPNLYDLPYFTGADEQDNFRKALYWERGFELAFEGQRKFDLLRWGILGDALKLFQDKMDPSLKGKFVAGDNFVKGKHELFPIPLGELQANPALNNQNNPGYE